MTTNLRIFALKCIASEAKKKWSTTTWLLSNRIYKYDYELCRSYLIADSPLSRTILFSRINLIITYIHTLMCQRSRKNRWHLTNSGTKSSDCKYTNRNVCVHAIVPRRNKSRARNDFVSFFFISKIKSKNKKNIRHQTGSKPVATETLFSATIRKNVQCVINWYTSRNVV